MMDRGIIFIIEKLNTEMHASGQFDDLEFLEYRSNGYSEIILFVGQRIWSSEDDERIYNDDDDSYEDLEIFLRRRVNILISAFSTIKLASK